MRTIAENAYSNTSDINHYANRIIDGYAGTYWRSETSLNPLHLPHYVIVKLEDTKVIKGFRYLPNQANKVGRIKNYNFYVSNDGVGWEKVSSGSWEKDKSAKKVRFDQAIEARYIKLEAMRIHEGEDIASIAEIDLIK